MQQMRISQVLLLLIKQVEEAKKHLLILPINFMFTSVNTTTTFTLDSTVSLMSAAYRPIPWSLNMPKQFSDRQKSTEYAKKQNTCRFLMIRNRHGARPTRSSSSSSSSSVTQLSYTFKLSRLPPIILSFSYQREAYGEMWQQYNVQ